MWVVTYSKYSGEPEGGLCERHGERAHVGPAYHIVIKVVQHEVRDERTPYRYVVEHRPVRRIQGYLKWNHHISIGDAVVTFPTAVH